MPSNRRLLQSRNDLAGPKHSPHGSRFGSVSFDEAATAFYDEERLFLDDPDHSENEDHFIILGISSALRLLVVVHCYRGDDATIRIISARKAVPAETVFYESHLRL